ncbi:copper amine oxidase N-terminal domain-containing protein [Neobacillus mesonae]|nr:copper amine oxidase N-terminal domain-containing protein [Neobacillus mesonae]
MNWKRIAQISVISALLVGVSDLPNQKVYADVDHALEVIIDDQDEKTVTQPYLDNGTVMVPLKMLHELNDVKIKWNNSSKTAVVTIGGQVYSLKPGQTSVSSASKKFTLDKPVVLEDNRIVVPASFLCEISGTEMRLDEMDRRLYLTTKQYHTLAVPGHDDIKLEALDVKNDYVKGMKLELKGKEHNFKEWEGMWNWRSKPEIYVGDLNGDNQEEIAVVNTLGYGTGLMIQEAHIVDLKTLKEIPIQSVEDVAEEWIDSQITSNDDHIEVKLKIKGQEEVQHILKDYAGYPSDRLNDEVMFEAIVYYSIEDGKLTARAGGSVGIAIFSGDLNIEYNFEDGAFKADKVSYSPYKD